ncbi:hypothetical protein ACFQE5_04795 [Pseudonocardia hispaniensis]|uniref:Uncharacterized protein n=1 Tax=Pseudonocardia hispaniensis TaxID=904933 RepID=A0ABW1IYK1_9PSEU
MTDTELTDRDLEQFRQLLTQPTPPPTDPPTADDDHGGGGDDEHTVALTITLCTPDGVHRNTSIYLPCPVSPKDLTRALMACSAGLLAQIGIHAHTHVLSSADLDTPTPTDPGPAERE